MQNEITRVEFTPAVITADFGAMQQELSKALEPYEGVTVEQIQDMPEADIKSCARDLRAMKKDLEDGRKGIKREYNRPLVTFERKVKELTSQIDRYLDLFAQVDKANEERLKENRMATLRAAYELFLAGNGLDELGNLVPAERLVERQWLNKSFSERKAVEGVEERAAKLVSDWNQLHGLGLAHQDECEAVFFESLDLGTAIAHDRMRTEQDERVRAMQEQAEAARREAQECREPEDGPDLEEELASLPQYEPYPGELEEAHAYVVRVSMTGPQKEALVGYMRANGIHGTIAMEAPEEAGMEAIMVTHEQAEAIRAWLEAQEVAA